MRYRPVVSALGLLLVIASPALAQGFRVRIDSRMQSVAWRGLELDSITLANAVRQPGGGYLTADGHATTCDDEWCHFFRAGNPLRGVPWVTQGDITAWGFGVPGLRVRAVARHATDLGESVRWPGSEPALQLVEGFAEYVRDAFTVQAGRQYLSSRLGGYGLDGARVAWQPTGIGVDAAVYGGWGLARGSVLPVTSPALNPLDDFQPRDRQVVVGAELGWTARGVDVRAEYRREVDPAVHYFVSERAAASVAVRPLARLSLSASGEYDLAFGHWGSADAAATYLMRRVSLTAGARRYLPFFDLWTIWGAFSPVPFHAWHGSLTVTPTTGLVLRARGERFVFDDARVSTPLVSVEDRGWRVSMGATWEASSRWLVSVGHDAEFGPGAASRGFDARVAFTATDALTMSAHAATLRRPLELRFSDASLAVYGADVDWRPGDRWRFSLGATAVAEQRDRPDAAAMDWNQFRLMARATWVWGSDNGERALPRAARTGGAP